MDEVHCSPDKSEQTNTEQTNTEQTRKAVATPAQRPMSPGRVLRTNRDFRKVWISGAVSDIGTWMQLMTVGTLVAARTGSALQTGLVAAATFSPQLVSSPVGGVLADRYDRRRVLMTVLALQAVAATVLAIAVGRSVGPGFLTLIVFGQGIVGSLANPVAASMTPDLVSKDALLGAASLGSVSWNSGRIVGPMLATLLIRGVGATWCIAANAASFAVLLLALSTVHRSFAPHATDLDDSVVKRVKQGIRSLRRTRTATFAFQVCLASQISIAPLIGMVPILATKILGGDSRTVSALFISFGVGSLLGSLAVTSIVARIGRPRASFGLLSAGALLTLVLSQVTSPLAAVLVVAPLGGCYIGGFVTVHSVIMRDSPPAERGRIASIFSASVGTGYSLGVLWMGALADATSLHVALAVAAISALAMLGISVVVVNRQWRSLGVGDMASQRALDRGLATVTTT
jgi:MFS family permease